MIADPSEEFIETFIKAIQANDLNEIKNLIQNEKSWCRVKKCGYPLIQEAIRYERKEIFDYMLQCHNIDDLEIRNVRNQEALMFALELPINRHVKEYFCAKLIQKGAKIQCDCTNDCDHESLLNLSMKSSLINITKLLLEKNIQVNCVCATGETPLHYALHPPQDNQICYELISMLLYYGTDPFLENKNGFNAFEYAVQICNFEKEMTDEILQLLCNYTIDNNSSIYLETIVTLGLNESPLFHQFISQPYRVILREVEPCYEITKLFNNLLHLKYDYFLLIWEKYNFLVLELIDIVPCDHEYFEMLRYVSFIKSDKCLEKLDVFMSYNLQSRERLITLFASLDHPVISRMIVDSSISQESIAAVIPNLSYFMQHGFIGHTSLYHWIFTMFGYCDFFKFLLCVDLDEIEITYYKITSYESNIMARIIYDVTFDIETIFQNPFFYLQHNGVEDLFWYFAHHKLNSLVLEYGDNECEKDNLISLSEEAKTKIRSHPEIPLLQEMARNVFRKYLVKRFDIKTTKHFYYILEKLPISNGHKKIITFETRLYF